MPNCNDRKNYFPFSTYHVFSRGINKRTIFHDSNDYKKFLQTCQSVMKTVPGIRISAFALMPNHFHFVFRQNTTDGMPRFMQRLLIRYVSYHNRRHGWLGSIFQSRYQAALKIGKQRIEDAQAYVFNNPKKAGLKKWPYVGYFTKTGRIKLIYKEL